MSGHGLREGKPAGSVHLVGHVMIDNLLHQLENMKTVGAGTTKVEIATAPERRFAMTEDGLTKGEYAFMTLHRPSNVDDSDTFMGIAEALNEIAEKMPILFPVHPRTKKMMEQFQIKFSENIMMMPPLGFKESLFLWKDAKVVLTDSGGLQEETTALGIPCVTIQENTERPITVEMGTNVLAGTTKEGILKAYAEALKKAKHATVPPLWDGKAAERIWEIIKTREAQSVKRIS